MHEMSTLLLSTISRFHKLNLGWAQALPLRGQKKIFIQQSAHSASFGFWIFQRPIHWIRPIVHGLDFSILYLF